MITCQIADSVSPHQGVADCTKTSGQKGAGFEVIATPRTTRNKRMSNTLLKKTR